MFYHQVNDRTELRLLGREQGGELFRLIDSNRAHLLPWHPWVKAVTSAGDLEKLIVQWQWRAAKRLGFHTGIWFEGELCGEVSHPVVDWPNRSTALSYWLAEERQGQGIMTACCRAMVAHGFEEWKLNRITIECATRNVRSRAIPERLGFKLEGIVRELEWLQDHFADHALYGLLRSEHKNQTTRPQHESFGTTFPTGRLTRG